LGQEHEATPEVVLWFGAMLVEKGKSLLNGGRDSGEENQDPVDCVPPGGSTRAGAAG
jgi:hypothetical protein